MNQVVIFFVPAGAMPRDIESALREYCSTRQIGQTPPQSKTARAEITDIDQLPLWTWFIPNSLRQPSLF